MTLDRTLLILACILAITSLTAFVWFTLRVVTHRHLANCRDPSALATFFCQHAHRRTWFDCLVPYRLLLRPICGYDLSQHPTIANTDQIRCPECGHIAHRGSLIAKQPRLRIGLTALITFALCLACTVTLSIRTDGWVRFAPSRALIILQESGLPWHERTMRSEIGGRVASGSASAWVAQHYAELLIKDLRDDNKDLNAYSARGQLWAMGKDARPALLKALTSPDLQQRQYAFNLIHELDAQCWYPSPDETLIKVAIEALRDDKLKDVENALAGLDYLQFHAMNNLGIVYELIETIKTTDDPQQRLLASVLSGYLGLEDAIDAAYPVLVECLADNNVPADARVAAPAIAHFGQPVIPFLERSLTTASDEQEKRILMILLFDLGAPSAPARRPSTRGLGINLRYQTTKTPLADILHSGNSYWLDDYVRAHREP